MRKFIILPVLLIFLIGCAGIQLNDTQSILGEIAARRIAYSLARSNPEIILPGLVICDGILKSSGESTARLANNALILLINTVGDDPMLKADLSTLLSVINISMPEKLPDSTMLKSVASAFKVGLDAAKQR